MRARLGAGRREKLSEQEMSDLVEQAIHNNAYTCLYKPLDMSTMLNLISEILSRKEKE